MDTTRLKNWLQSLPTPLFSSKVALKPSSIHGQGLHATRHIIPGEILVYDQGIEVHESVVHLLVELLGHENALRIDWDKYLLDAPVGNGAYINHSCDPNVGFANDRTFVSLYEIEEGEEILLDYSTSEVAEHWRMNCKCGATNCRGEITGKDHALPELRERLGEWYSPFLKKYWSMAEQKVS